MFKRAIDTYIRLFICWLAVFATASNTHSDTVRGLDEPVRALHLVLRAVTPNEIHERVELASNEGYNVLVLRLSDGVAFESFPGTLRKDAWSIEEFKSLVDYAGQQGLAVVPEIKFLTHQEHFLQNAYPDLMFNSATANPNLEQVRSIQTRFLNEVIELTRPKAIHIGHDEIAGHNEVVRRRLLQSNESILPSDIFLDSVLWLHEELRTRGIETWMWGDMLISPSEFPKMLPRHLHGTLPGYGRELRQRIPKDIVICDWHYLGQRTEYPSLSTFLNEGFKVLGATWKQDRTTRNFVRYATNHDAQGMIATTWFHVQRKEWETVDDIITTSGEIFRESFPTPVP